MSTGVIPGIVLEAIQAALVAEYPQAETISVEAVHYGLPDGRPLPLPSRLHTEVRLNGVRYGWAWQPSGYDEQRVGGWEAQAAYLVHVALKEYRTAIAGGFVVPDPRMSKAAQVALQLGTALNNLAAVHFREFVRALPASWSAERRREAGMEEISPALDALAALRANVHDFPITATFADEVDRRAKELGT